MIVAAFACLLAVAQDPGSEARATSPGLELEALDNGARIRVEPIPGAADVSLVLVAPVGPDQDPPGQSGIARVLAALLRARLPASTPRSPGMVATIGSSTTIIATVPREQWRGRLEELAELLGGEVELSDDEILSARGKALLRADDELHELPGPALRARAVRTLLAGEPAGRLPGGVPAELRALEPDAIRAYLRRGFGPDGTALVVIGGVDPVDGARFVEETIGAVRNPRAVALPVTVHDGGPPFVDDEVHPRVDAPFVTAAVRAPEWGDADFLPFLIAVQVIRTRAFRKFQGFRGGEVRAEFPFVGYDLLLAPHVLTINRRGRDGASVESVRREIESMVASLAVGGASLPEIGSIVQSMNSALRLPPYEARELPVLAENPAALHNRAWVIATYLVRGWPADLTRSLGQIPVRFVLEELREMLAEDRLRWFVFRPAEQPRSAGK